MLFKPLLVCVALLAACTPATVPSGKANLKEIAAARAEVEKLAKNGTLARFDSVVKRVVPVAERQCRARTQGVKCRLRVSLDVNPAEPPNAFQTLDGADRPVIVFTIALLEDTRNADELALILGHEAAHHILGHVLATREQIRESALLRGMQAAAHGGNKKQIEAAEQKGAISAILKYSKAYEIKADELGTIIAARAGFDPVHGAEYFVRMKNPGNQFLTTHPPNRARRAVVRATARKLRAGIGSQQ